MPSHLRTLLIIGATGMLGRPVVRRLLAEGFALRALVRDPARAAALLPMSGNLELFAGDLQDAASLDRAMTGEIDAVYINLAAPMRKRPPAFEPERDGTRNIIAAAKRTGVNRILRISAMGVDEAAERWWPAAHKAEADRALMDSGLAWTIFRPTWFMESLATMARGRTMISIHLGSDDALRWIAGDDYARMVAWSLQHPGETVGRVFMPQGPEPLTITEAAHRFARAHEPRLRTRRISLGLMRFAAPFSGKMSYLVGLMDMTVKEFMKHDRQVIDSPLPRAHMTIESYISSMRETGDVPRK